MYVPTPKGGRYISYQQGSAHVRDYLWSPRGSWSMHDVPYSSASPFASSLAAITVAVIREFSSILEKANHLWGLYIELS